MSIYSKKETKKLPLLPRKEQMEQSRATKGAGGISPQAGTQPQSKYPSEIPLCSGNTDGLTEEIKIN